MHRTRKWMGERVREVVEMHEHEEEVTCSPWEGRPATHVRLHWNASSFLWQCKSS